MHVKPRSRHSCEDLPHAAGTRYSGDPRASVSPPGAAARLRCGRPCPAPETATSPLISRGESMRIAFAAGASVHSRSRAASMERAGPGGLRQPADGRRSAAEDGPDGALECRICGEKFHSAQQLSGHQISHQNDGSWVRERIYVAFRSCDSLLNADMPSGVRGASSRAQGGRDMPQAQAPCLGGVCSLPESQIDRLGREGASDWVSARRRRRRQEPTTKES